MYLVVCHPSFQSFQGPGLRKTRSLIQLRPGEPPEEPEGRHGTGCSGGFFVGCTRRFTSAGRHIGLGEGFCQRVLKVSAAFGVGGLVQRQWFWSQKGQRSSPALECALFRGNNGSGAPARAAWSGTPRSSWKSPDPAEPVPPACSAWGPEWLWFVSCVLSRGPQNQPCDPGSRCRPRERPSPPRGGPSSASPPSQAKRGSQDRGCRRNEPDDL